MPATFWPVSGGIMTGIAMKKILSDMYQEPFRWRPWPVPSRRCTSLPHIFIVPCPKDLMIYRMVTRTFPKYSSFLSFSHSRGVATADLVSPSPLDSSFPFISPLIRRRSGHASRRVFGRLLVCRVHGMTEPKRPGMQPVVSGQEPGGAAVRGMTPEITTNGGGATGS
jgi:hypothetical protein